MRTTIDIPDDLYRKLKAKAAIEGSTVKQIIVGLVDRELQEPGTGKRVQFPIIRGKTKSKLRITNEEIDEILFG